LLIARQSWLPGFLSTVVDLAQRNSGEVKIAQANVAKSQAVLAESKDVIIPSLSLSTGVPAFPEEASRAHRHNLERHDSVVSIQHSAEVLH